MKFFDKPTLLVFFVSLVTLVLWVIEEGTLSTNDIASYIGSIAGILAITFMSFDFLSSTRWKFFEKFAGGLDITYRFHSYMGKLAAIIILAHPLFLMIQRFTGIETIQRYLVPGTIEFFNWGIVAFWLLLLLVIFTLFVKMPYGWWKYTHLVMVAVFLFASYHVFLDYTNAQRSPGLTLKEIWMFGIIIVGLVSLVYKELLYPFLGKSFKVTKVNPIGLVTEVYMESVKGKMNFIPGQFVFIAVMDSKELSNESHPFGITSSVNDSGIRVSIKALGDWTKKAPLIKPGNTIHVWGPYGMFNWESVEKYQKQVWIAGGIGVAPFLAMTKYANDIKTDKDITLYYVEKNAGECEYNAELSEMTKDGRVKFYNHYDDSDGFLTAKAVQEKVGDLKDAVVMICGPKPMMRALKKQFLDMGLKPEQIKEEEFEMRK